MSYWLNYEKMSNTSGHLVCPLEEFCTIGMACHPDNWMYRKSFARREQHEWHNLSAFCAGWVSYKFESADISSSCWWMDECHPDEFSPIQISRVYVIDNFIRLAGFIIVFYGVDHAISTPTEVRTEEDHQTIVCSFLFCLLGCQERPYFYIFNFVVAYR
jgi:hypothetical protein